MIGIDESTSLLILVHSNQWPGQGDPGFSKIIARSAFSTRAELFSIVAKKIREKLKEVRSTKGYTPYKTRLTAC